MIHGLTPVGDKVTGLVPVVIVARTGGDGSCKIDVIV
jgi:hypothetical protein